MDKKLILLEHLAIAKTQITLNSKIDGVKLPPHLMGKQGLGFSLNEKSIIRNFSCPSTYGLHNHMEWFAEMLTKITIDGVKNDFDRKLLSIIH